MLYTRSVGAWVSAQERDAEVAELQERLAQLRALEQERGLPTPGSSDTPRVIAAQLRIEQLQRQLREALHVRPNLHPLAPLLRSFGHSSRAEQHCNPVTPSSSAAEGRGAYSGTVLQAASRQACHDRSISFSFVVLNCSHSIKLPMQATPHALSFSPAQTAAVTTPGVSGEQDGSMEELAQKHAAEVASLQAAFRARLAAAEEDLQVWVATVSPICMLLQHMGIWASPGLDPSRMYMKHARASNSENTDRRQGTNA